MCHEKRVQKAESLEKPTQGDGNEEEMKMRF